MRARHLVLLTLAFIACGGGGGGGAAAPHDHASANGPGGAVLGRAARDPGELDAVPDDEIPGPDVPYDRAIQKSVHNAYERFEPLLDQLVYHRVRSLELDVHTRQQGTSAPAGDWFVFHEDTPLTRRTSCQRLSDCLGQLAAFHEAIPRHEVVTIFVDLKSAFDDHHRPSDLDAAFVGALGRERIVTPGDVIAACPSARNLREAVSGPCHFPTLRALRGKFLVAVTGGTACDPSSLVTRYAAGDPTARLGFIAPNVDRGRCTIPSYDARPNVVFFNVPFVAKDRVGDVRSRGLVARVYGGGVGGSLDVANHFRAASSAGATHLATNKVSFEVDGWAVSHRPRGYPFTCEGCDDDLVEPGHTLGIRAASGDIWGRADSAMLAYESDDADATWSALVSVPSSHVEPFAKACLFARASDQPGAANVAVCRTFDRNAPRAQVRTRPSGATIAINASSFDGVTTESPAFLRLATRSVGTRTEVTASASRDGKSWTTITTTTVDGSLPIRGASVSSHGRSRVKGLFTNLVRERDGTRTLMTKSRLRERAIGVANGDTFDGVFPP